MNREGEGEIYSLFHFLVCYFSFLHSSNSRGRKKKEKWKISGFFFVCLFFLTAAPEAYGSFQASGLIRAADAGLCHSHSNAKSEPPMWPVPQLEAMLDP